MKAWELLSQPDSWCQNKFACDIAGAQVAPDSPKACKWCASGAINRCYGPLPPDEHDKAIGKVYEVLYNKYNSTDILFVWNDSSSRTREQVVELLKEADV